MSGQRFLMCPPDHFGIDYEINPWMNRQVQPDRELARRQWDLLREILEGKLGAAIEMIDAASGLPDMVFTANAGYVEEDVFIPSRFRYGARQGEEPLFRAWFTAMGYTVKDLPGPWSFEGFGDALPWRERVFAGYRFRSDIQAHAALGNLLGKEVISLELTDSRFYHLDTCFCPLRSGDVIIYPGAFDEYGVRAIRGIIGGERLLEVSEGEAAAFCCNAVEADDGIVMNLGAPGLAERLRSRGYRVFEADFSEFVKSGGSAKCLICRIA